jgi:hypothetical protein
MATHSSYKRQMMAAVGPLIIVICAALIWSGYATYHHVVGDKVPSLVGWTLIVALDGTVVVTTPVWLSTLLPAKVRNYAALICVGALCGSMAINFAQTGWPGVFPPLIAGALIHLVGVVLRAFDRLRNEPTTGASQEAEHEMPPVVAGPDPVEVKTAPNPSPRPVPKVSLAKKSEVQPYELVSRLLIEAYAKEADEPSGARLTAAVRAAGHDVNDNYGRSAKARWKKNREQVSI